MEREKSRKNRRIIKINGVRIANGENSQKINEPQKDATANTKDLIWIADKENLEL